MFRQEKVNEKGRKYHVLVQIKETHLRDFYVYYLSFQNSISTFYIDAGS
jgi:hypothetical protein